MKSINKQIVAFLSLFSLVLVLSIYYIMIPIDGKDQTVNGTPDIGDVVDGKILYFQTLDEERTSYLKGIINDIDAKLASSIANNEKEDLLNERKKIENTITCETAIEKVIMDLGVPASFAKIEDNLIIVILYKTDKTDEDKVVVATMSEVFKITGKIDNVQVSFKG